MPSTLVASPCGRAPAVSARQRHAAITFVAFDVLRLDGRSLIDYDVAGRREVLECRVRLSDGGLTAVSTFPGADVDDVLAGCAHLAMEGVVLKRLGSPYLPGRRSADWRKVKCPAWRVEHAERRVKL